MDLLLNIAMLYLEEAKKIKDVSFIFLIMIIYSKMHFIYLFIIIILKYQK